MWAVCEFHGSNSNGFGDIWWTDKPIYFSSIDIMLSYVGLRSPAHGLHIQALEGSGRWRQRKPQSTLSLFVF